tara:strand:+ start:119 stop:778 length:660 start_codon:yes stop_codon:yes gene_type:complete
MKEVIMKNIISFIVLICSVAVILTSCSKDEESTTAATTTSKTTTTPSGSITMGSYTASGVYLSSCFSGSSVSTLVSAGSLPSDAQSFGFAFVVTGDDSFTSETHVFTDTGCTTSTYISKALRDNVTVGTASGANYPVTYNDQGFKLTVNTTTAETWLETLYANLGRTLDFTVGREMGVYPASFTLTYGLWTPSATTIYLATESDNSTPSTAGTLVYTME